MRGPSVKTYLAAINRARAWELERRNPAGTRVRASDRPPPSPARGATGTDAKRKPKNARAAKTVSRAPAAAAARTQHGDGRTSSSERPNKNEQNVTHCWLVIVAGVDGLRMYALQWTGAERCEKRRAKSTVYAGNVNLVKGSPAKCTVRRSENNKKHHTIVNGAE